MVSLPPRPLIVVRFTSPLSGIRSQQATDAFLQFWDSLQASAFHPVAVIRVLSRSSGLHGDGTHSCDSPLGSAPLVFGTWSSSRWLLQWSYRPVSASCAWLGLVISTQISVGSGFMPGDSPALSKSSWLLLRYCGAVFAGAPSILARSVSGTMSIYHGWCHSDGHSISNPTFAMLADSCVTYGTPRALVCPPCVVTVQFYLRFSVFTFHPCLRIRCFGFCYAPSNSLQRRCVLSPHTWPCPMVLPI